MFFLILVYFFGYSQPYKRKVSAPMQVLNQENYNENENNEGIINVQINEIFIPQNLDQGVLSYLQNNKIGSYDYPLLSLKKNIPQKVLLCILNYYLEIQVCINNINNKKTTKLLDGLPFKRKLVEIDKNGNIEIRNDISDDYYFAYDPTHPNALQNGKEKGYVRYPNINTKFEVDELRIYENIYNLFVANGKRIYPQLLMAEIHYSLKNILYEDHYINENDSQEVRKLLNEWEHE